MKKLIPLFLLALTFSSFAHASTLDDAISEELAPLLSNYFGDYQAQFEAVHVLTLEPGISKSNPILLIPPKSLEADSLQDCEEADSSIVCELAKKIEAFIKFNGITKGKVVLNIKVLQKKKLVKELKDIEVLSF